MAPLPVCRLYMCVVLTHTDCSLRLSSVLRALCGPLPVPLRREGEASQGHLDIADTQGDAVVEISRCKQQAGQTKVLSIRRGGSHVFDRWAVRDGMGAKPIRILRVVGKEFCLLRAVGHVMINIIGVKAVFQRADDFDLRCVRDVKGKLVREPYMRPSLFHDRIAQ